MLDQLANRAHGTTLDRYKLLLLLLAIALIPLFYVNLWLGLAAAAAIYGLVARLATKDLDRQL